MYSKWLVICRHMFWMGSRLLFSHLYSPNQIYTKKINIFSSCGFFHLHMRRFGRCCCRLLDGWSIIAFTIMMMIMTMATIKMKIWVVVLVTVFKELVLLRECHFRLFFFFGRISSNLNLFSIVTLLDFAL